MQRRALVQKLMIALSVLHTGHDAWATSGMLLTTDSLPNALAKALRAKQPLLVMVSLQGCPFCKIVRENYLHPLLRDEGMQIVQIDMRDNRTIVDFDGSSGTQDAWIRKYGIKLAPTVLFFGDQGREVAMRLKGAYLPDFYGAYLDEQLVVARKAIATPKTSQNS
jgi:thioredoxin-related protein